MSKAPSLSQRELCELLDYDKETGILLWRKRPREMFTSDRAYKIWNSRNAGREAGCNYTSGTGNEYRRLTIFKWNYRAHRVIWKMVYGEWPINSIDHIDGNGRNNCISNLRDADHTENSRNKKKHATNTSGVCGVSWRKRDSCWVARIYDGNKEVHLGRFLSLEDAKAARVEAERRLGYSKTHGKR